ncbi:hypothetical protein BX600DRAFT_4824 [Xylariales sp. PMI_506]|nr:hypothetical protein BX600DRAFT_4824 [Xylariales sp. PMI_506]
MPISRKKSCAQCRAAKARCSLEQPTCSRCTDRDLRCDYASAFPRRIRQRQSSSAGTESRKSTTGNSRNSVRAPWTALAQGGICLPVSARAGEAFRTTLLAEDDREQSAVDGLLEDALAMPPFDTIGSTDWSNTEFSFPDLQLPMWEATTNKTHIIPTLGDANEVTPDFIISCNSPMLLQADEATSSDMQSPTSSARYENRIQDPLQPRSVSGDPAGKKLVISGRAEGDILAPKRTTSTHSFLVMQILLGQIAAYPGMMIQEILPPFIYPMCMMNGRLMETCLRDGMHQCLPEPLAICASMVQMFQQRTAQSRSFVWKTIVKEHKRLADEHRMYDQELLLATTQAMLVYVLLHAQETTPISQSDVRFMIATLGAALKLLHEISNFHLDIYAATDQLTHRKWALHESMIRTANTLWVVETLLNVIFGRRESDACGGFTGFTLPCPRDLWDYRASREGWNHRLRRFLASSRIPRSSTTTTTTMKTKNRDAPLRIMDLLRLARKGQPRPPQVVGGGDDDGLAGEVARWCAGLDEFGTLVWMAAALD